MRFTSPEIHKVKNASLLLETTVQLSNLTTLRLQIGGHSLPQIVWSLSG